MKYQGPESLRTVVEDSYERIKTNFSREDTPHVIVGGIGRIYNDGEKTITEGDSETNSAIDENTGTLFFVSKSAPHLTKRASARLRASCADANILGETVFGEYNNSLDVVVLAPYNVFRYKIVSRFNPNQICTMMENNNIEALYNYSRDMSFPNRFAHEMIHWDYGDTQFNRDLQKYFHALGFTFDKSRDGKFSFETAPRDVSSYRTDASEAAVIGQYANNRLSNHFAKMIELGIYDLGEIVADIGATFISMPYSGLAPIDHRGHPEITEKLINMCESDGPAEFIKELKTVQDEAYSEDRVVFDLLR